MRPQHTVITTESPEATRDLAARLAVGLPPFLVVLLLVGPLGSGKTTFVQGLAKGLGVRAGVTSPSFLLMKDYDEGLRPMRHIDLFRLDSPEKARSLGLTADLPDDAVVAVEWADRFRLPFSAPLLTVVFALGTGENERTLTFSAEDDAEISGLLDALRSG